MTLYIHPPNYKPFLYTVLTSSSVGLIRLNRLRRLPEEESQVDGRLIDSRSVLFFSLTLDQLLSINWKYNCSYHLPVPTLLVTQIAYNFYYCIGVT